MENFEIVNKTETGLAVLFIVLLTAFVTIIKPKIYLDFYKMVQEMWGFNVEFTPRAYWVIRATGLSIIIIFLVWFYFYLLK